ncbi:MAG: lamin tail domain-containing protein [Bacteroidota bacterium]
MKKLYFLLVAILVTSLSFGQDLIITGIIDGPLPGGTPKGLELYVVNNIPDLSIYGLESTTNGAAAAGEEFTFPNDPATAGTFIYVATEVPNFTQYLGVAPTYTNGVMGVNGDDTVILYQNGSIVDSIGEIGVDGTGTAWDYLDGWAYRSNGFGPNATFSAAEWTFSGANATDGCDLGDDTGTNAGCASVFPIGTYTPSGSSCGVTFGSATVTCLSNTIGDNNDNVTINIPYTGSDAGITSVTTTSGGTVGGDDPASVADGTITITGLTEGAAWDIVLNGGDCDTRSTSGMVTAAECDPTPSTCFDLSGGSELFELVAVTTNSDTDVWTESSGTYTMNGFCGGGCMEESDTWLIFGPLDMTSVTDLELIFDAAEGFDGTDLLIRYTDAYTGCPDATTWTTAQTISAAGNYSVDVSGASGTDAFIGIQYQDADGSFSSWSLSNVELAAFGSCPTLGSRPTSDCATCDLSLQMENYVCLTNTSGSANDGVTVEIPYTGFDATLVSVTTTSGGTIAGDNPLIMADGTITITGLTEGDAWDLTLNGGNCDGTTVSGNIPANNCDPVTCANVGDIIVTEIMQNPNAVGDTLGEWFEVYNTTGASIDLIGWTISDDGSNTHVIASSVVVGGNDYAVLGINADTMTNGGVTIDYEYSGFSLGNSDDEVILTCGGNEIDRVNYDGGPNFPDPTGASMELSTTALNSMDNDNGANWGTATSSYGDGDLGTPGAANDFILSTGDFETASFSIYPNPSSAGFVNITSSNSEAIDVIVYDILGKQVKNETISNNVLNVSDLNTGLYILKITQNEATATKKLVIKQ